MESVDKNLLYPVFFRLDRLKMLIVGAGEVGTEKLHFILKSSPNARITIVATWVSDSAQELIDSADHIRVILREAREEDVQGHDLIVSATNFPAVNKQVHAWAKKHDKIVNVADTPPLCDFYMGSIVTRGNLKVAISTNGKSPTFAKRFRQFVERMLPNESVPLMENLKLLRDDMSDDFAEKVRELNKLTETLLFDKQQEKNN